MTAIKKTDTIINNTNLSNENNAYVYIARKAKATDSIIYWDHKNEIQWEKYQIKETDMRTKTATFTTPQYLDLTTGQYCVLITSTDHEDFAGVIIDVELSIDPKNGLLYNYQCQDFSRTYQSKIELISENVTIHRILEWMISRGGVPIKGNVKKQRKTYKKALSGLRPAWQYWEQAWGGVIKDYNPMTVKQKMIIRNKSWIEAIRDLVYGLGMFIDVYFDKYGVLHIEPFVKDEWLHTGLYLTTPELASAKFKFDTTNVITGTLVHNKDNTKKGTYYSSDSLINLDLSMFFGDLRASVDNPDTSSTTTKTAGKSNTGKKSSKTKAKKNTNIYGTKKKNVYLNIDSINGHSSDMQKMKDISKVLKKNGWNVTITGVGSEAHWKRRGEVKNGIWFCLYGGACAGTLREHCEQTGWFINPIKKNKSRVVVGFFPPSGSILKGGKYYKHLGPAHDWQGNRAYANIDYPAKFLSKKGVPFMYAGNAKQMAAKFLAGGDNYSTTGNSYKYYDSWVKHKPKWL